MSLAFHPETTDLVQVIRDCCEMQQELTPAAFIEIFTYPEVIILTCDPNLMSQAIGNLLSNAVKYSPPGSRITAAVNLVADRVTVVIEDQGIGVPERDRPHLFESYYRGSNTASVVGSGVGLYLVKAIAALHDASVEFEPVSTRGSRFTLRIALKSPPPAAAESA